MSEPGTLSIEQAWEGLLDVIWLHPDPAKDEGALQLARNFALAVLEALEETEGAGYNSGMGRWECDFDSVRERIEALGRAEPGP